jgi:serine/threonine protein kinase
MEGAGHAARAYRCDQASEGPPGERFEQEARAIAALNHPNICQIHDVGPDYLVLEYTSTAKH